METRAQPLRHKRLAVLLARPWASRLIATLGIVVMMVGLYVPIAGRDVIFDGDLIGSHSETRSIGDVVDASLARALLHEGSASLLVHLGFDAVYSVLTLGGLALIPLLWRRLSPKGTAWVRWTYAAWLLLLTMLAVAGLSMWWQSMSQPIPGPSLPGQLPRFITFGAPYLLPGAVVFPLGVLFSGAALLLMLREPLPMPVPAPAPRTDWQRTASLVLTAGLLVWVAGFYLMPEAVTATCPPVIFSVTQFAHGACAGLDSDQVLAAASSSRLDPITAVLYNSGRNYEFLVALGCITALGGWTRQLSVQTLAWLAAWPVLAMGTALVALQGVGVAARRGFMLTIASGAGWHMAAGMVVTFGGIGLVALGQVGLWRELVRRKGAASA